MLAAFLAITLYAGLAGATPSVVRAAIMGGLSVLAVQLGRQQNGLNSLAFVAAVMALFAPMILWDVGFQLSFMATLGLILYAGPLSQAFTGLAARRVPQAHSRYSNLWCLWGWVTPTSLSFRALRASLSRSWEVWISTRTGRSTWRRCALALAAPRTHCCDMRVQARPPVQWWIRTGMVCLTWCANSRHWQLS
jgi:predicted membrane metal-binding protein